MVEGRREKVVDWLGGKRRSLILEPAPQSGIPAHSNLEFALAYSSFFLPLLTLISSCLAESFPEGH